MVRRPGHLGIGADDDEAEIGMPGAQNTKGGDQHLDVLAGAEAAQITDDDIVIRKTQSVRNGFPEAVDVYAVVDLAHLRPRRSLNGVLQRSPGRGHHPEPVAVKKRRGAQIVKFRRNSLDVGTEKMDFMIFP